MCKYRRRSGVKMWIFFLVRCEARTSQQTTYSVARQQESVRYKKKTRLTNNELHYTRVRTVTKKRKYWLRHVLSSSVLPCVHFSLYIQPFAQKNSAPRNFILGGGGGGV